MMTREQAEAFRAIISAAETLHIELLLFSSLRPREQRIREFASAIEKANDFLTFEGVFCPACSGDGGKNGGCPLCHGDGLSRPATPQRGGRE